MDQRKLGVEKSLKEITNEDMKWVEDPTKGDERFCMTKLGLQHVKKSFDDEERVHERKWN